MLVCFNYQHSHAKTKYSNYIFKQDKIKLDARIRLLFTINILIYTYIKLRMYVYKHFQVIVIYNLKEKAGDS